MKKALRALAHPRVRIGISLVLILALSIIAYRHLNFVSEGWKAIQDANWSWIAASVAFLALSMYAQAEVMVALLKSAGVSVRRWKANVLGLSANAWSASFPGGAAVSAAVVFREQLKWGSTAVIASWYMVLSGLLASGSMAVIALTAIWFFGLEVQPVTLVLSVIGLGLLVLGVNFLAHRPHMVEEWVIKVLKIYNRVMKRPEDRFADSVRGFAKQLQAVKLSLPRLIHAFLASTLNWLLEIACLLACLYAVGATPAIAGVTLSFLAAKLVGQAQVTPSGLGTVDVTLTSTLVALAQISSGHAFAAVIVYRMLSFVALTIIGWCVFFSGQILSSRRKALESKE